MENLLNKDSVKRVQEFIAKFDPKLKVLILDSTARTALDAAKSLNCEVGAIVKSLVFKTDDKFTLCLVAGDKKASLNKIKKNLNLMRRDSWRNEERPVIQIECPYAFITDDDIYLTQLPQFLNFNSSYWPGTLIAGRFNITNRPRTLSWAFEWHDLSQDLILKRGKPWFYVFFESDNPEDTYKLVEAEYTNELRKFKNSILWT